MAAFPEHVPSLRGCAGGEVSHGSIVPLLTPLTSPYPASLEPFRPRASQASSQASANFVCQAVGARSVGYGRAYFVADAKWQALIRCERYSGICIISYCVPAY